MDIREDIRRRRATERVITLKDGPWPESIAGAIVGGLLASDLAVIPQVGAYMTVLSGALTVTAAGAIVGAAASWWTNRGPRRVTVRREAPVREDRAAA